MNRRRRSRVRFKPGQSHLPPRVPTSSWRTERVATWFDLRAVPKPETGDPKPEFEHLLPAPGKILLLTGASGSGKSTLLRRLIAQIEAEGRRVIDLARLPLPDLPVVDCLPELSLEAALMLLGRMGLGEAWTYLRTPTELSDGQRWRLRLAVAVHEAGRTPNEPVTIVCDEFAALLDRITAAVVSRSIRRLIDAMPRLSAILATAHDDVIRPLSPNRIVTCDFGAHSTP